MPFEINEDIETVVKSLKTNNFDPVEFVEEVDTATKLVLNMTPSETTVGVPGSTSVRQTGIVAQLKNGGQRSLMLSHQASFLLRSL